MKLQPKQKQRLLREVFESINEVHSDPVGDLMQDFEEAIEKLWTVFAGLNGHPGIAAAVESHTTALDNLSSKLGRMLEPAGAPDYGPTLSPEQIVDEIHAYLDYSGMDVNDVLENGGPDGIVQMAIDDDELGITEDDEADWLTATSAVEAWMESSR